MPNTGRETQDLENQIVELLADAEYSGHPLREALAGLYARYQEHLSQLEKLASISDGYQAVMRDHNRSLLQRYEKQMRNLQKIVRISDHYQKILSDLNEELKIASFHDPLTELPNRRLIIERMATETAAVERGRETFSLAVLDVDHFKTINDNWGHAVGDTALIAIARTLMNGLRVYDTCARWGGEEFLILLPETTREEACEITERLRESIHALELLELPHSHKATVSIGVAEHYPHTPFEETIKRADNALFEAKREGRNRAIVAD